MAELPMMKDGFHHNMVLSGVPKADRTSPHSVHPVQQIQREFHHSEWNLSGKRFDEMHRMYGRDFAMRMRLELAVTQRNSANTRLGPLPRSRVMEETLVGKDTSVEFEDYFGHEDFTDEPPADPRAMMEAQMNM
eukprot:TRINITY_DN4885_c0_g1_i1.p1 TRINITY_DN4885_c0_g1~~TRINITY_DN4885_c0_g1_i1.p1  ORF type:complete len:145 (-),score=49.70 TRINITY_DN4885_c0_g1_i1:371-772(-)